MIVLSLKHQRLAAQPKVSQCSVEAAPTKSTSITDSTPFSCRTRYASLAYLFYCTPQVQVLRKTLETKPTNPK